MKIRAIWTGKTKDPHLAALLEDFAGRVRRFLPFDIVELREGKRADPLLAAIGEDDRVIALDPGGTTWTSAEFATLVGHHMQYDRRTLTFAVGGADGIGDAVRKRADLLWSLSALTFTHDMARFILLEQIYRALATLRNHPYPR
jgi:23S rRNA (pseudouridine1915-N3)-methyltransferase